MKVNVNDWKDINEATDNPYKTLQLISDIAENHDGYHSEEKLKSLIDELKEYADHCLKKARTKGEIE